MPINSLTFRKIRASLGGRVRIMMTGAAPIAEDVLNFARVALGVHFTEGKKDKNIIIFFG